MYDIVPQLLANDNLERSARHGQTENEFGRVISQLPDVDLLITNGDSNGIDHPIVRIRCEKTRERIKSFAKGEGTD